MSKIITLFKRHYIGTAAEIGGITGVCGDTAYSTDTDIYYSWSGSAWITGGEPYWVERLTNVPDKQVGDFTCDGNPHVNGLDLSGIVPPGAVKVKLQVKVDDDAANSFIMIDRDAVNIKNSVQVKIFVANLSNIKTETISIDSDRLLDYLASNLVFAVIDVTVLGWWMRRCL